MERRPELLTRAVPLLSYRLRRRLLRIIAPSGCFLWIALSPITADAAEVAVDVGHTLLDGGATSARGRPEFAFNLSLSRVLNEALEARSLRVRQINFDGRIARLSDRPVQAAGADFFIAIHHDSVQPELLREWIWQGSTQTYSDLHSGYSLFVSHDNPSLSLSLRCASAMGAMLRRRGFVPATHHVDPQTGLPRPAADAEHGVYYYDDLLVLRRTTLPAVLFEAGVIKHRDEEMALLNPQRQANMADAVATGIAACLYAP